MNYGDIPTPRSKPQPEESKSQSPYGSQQNSKATTPQRPSSSQKLRRMWISSSARKKVADKHSPTPTVLSLRHQSMRPNTGTPARSYSGSSPSHRFSANQVSERDVSSYLYRKEREHTDIKVKRLGANGEDSKDEFEIKKRKTNTTKHPTVDLHNAHEIEVADNTPIRKPAKEATEDPIYSQIDVKDYLKQMSDEIMRYEIRLASLHGRMVELTRENQRLRNDDNYRLICKRLAGKLVAESKERGSWKDVEERNREENSVEAISDTTSISNGGDIQETDEHYDKKPAGVPIVSQVDSPQDLSLLDKNHSECHSKPKRALEKLEKGILKRLHEYDVALKSAEDEASMQLCGARLVKDESPFVEELKNKLLNGASELAKVRVYTATRVANLKAALSKQQVDRQFLQKMNEEYRSALMKWENFGENVKGYVPHYIETIKRQKETIDNQNRIMEMQILATEEQKKTIQELRAQLSQVESVQADSLSCTELNRVTTLQKRDIDTLKQYLHEEKLKSEHLKELVEHLRKDLATRGAANPEYARLAHNAAQKDVEEKHRMEIRTLHKMYSNLLKNVEMNERENKETPKENANDDPYGSNGHPIYTSPRVKKEHSPEDLLNDQSRVTLESP